jgi:hypothetical protein
MKEVKQAERGSMVVGRGRNLRCRIRGFGMASFDVPKVSGGGDFFSSGHRLRVCLS